MMTFQDDRSAQPLYLQFEIGGGAHLRQGERVSLERSRKRFRSL